MKKWMIIVVVGAFMVGMAVADGTNVPWYKKPFSKSADEQTQVIPPAPVAPAVAPEISHMQRPEGQGDKKHSQMTPEQKEKMKAQHEALMKLGDMARNETDPAKKEALIGQIRVKVAESVDKMLVEQKKRLEQAEAELPKLKERIAEAEKNKADRIEKQVQRILSGEPLRGPDGNRPDGALKKEGKKEAKKSAPTITE